MKMNIVILEGNVIHCTKALGKFTSVLDFGTEFTLVAFALLYSSGGTVLALKTST